MTGTGCGARLVITTLCIEVFLTLMTSARLRFEASILPRVAPPPDRVRRTHERRCVGEVGRLLRLLDRFFFS